MFNADLETEFDLPAAYFAESAEVARSMYAIESGAWARDNSAILDKAALDVGYRLITANVRAR